jgi:hypothetical protein
MRKLLYLSAIGISLALVCSAAFAATQKSCWGRFWAKYKCMCLLHSWSSLSSAFTSRGHETSV